MIRLTVAGPQTAILSSLCAQCSFSPAGCCTAPPRIDLSDVGRIVALGGREWLRAELAAGRILVAGRWLVLKRVKRVPRPDAARIATCVYLGEHGCTLGQEKRAATCNYYVCEEALVNGGPDGPRAREVHAELVATFTAWDEELQRRAAETWPDPLAFDDPAFLDWLGAAFEELAAGQGASTQLSSVAPSTATPPCASSASSDIATSR